MNNDLDLSESGKEIAASSPAEFLAESFTLYAKTTGANSKRRAWQKPSRLY